MSRPLRIVDSGMQRPTWHLAASAALSELHRAGAIPDTLRFQLFPPCALLGRHQILAAEIDADWCAAQGVTVARRITGGGAIIMAPGILGWELLLPAARFPAGLGQAAAEICQAVAAGLSGLGIAARYRPRNDIEVDGRKLSGTGGYVDGSSLLYQGTVLVALDRTLLRGALRWPSEKRPRQGVASLDDRVVDLHSLLGRSPTMAPLAMETVQGALINGLAALDLTPVPGALAAAEQALAAQYERTEIATPAFIAGSDLPPGGGLHRHVRQTPGGTFVLEVRLWPGSPARIAAIRISGDCFVTPPRTLADLESALKDVPLADAAPLAGQLLATCGARFLGAGPEDLLACLAAIQAAAEETPCPADS